MDDRLNRLIKGLKSYQPPVQEETFEEILSRIENDKKRRTPVWILMAPIVLLGIVGLGFVLFIQQSNRLPSKKFKEVTQTQERPIKSPDDSYLATVQNKTKSKNDFNGSHENNPFLPNGSLQKNNMELNGSIEYASLENEITADGSSAHAIKFEKNERPFRNEKMMASIPTVNFDRILRSQSEVALSPVITQTSIYNESVAGNLRSFGHWEIALSSGISNISIAPNRMDDIYYLDWDITPWNSQYYAVSFSRTISNHLGLSLGYRMQKYRLGFDRLIPTESRTFYFQESTDGLDILAGYVKENQKLEFLAHQITLAPFYEQELGAINFRLYSGLLLALNNNLDWTGNYWQYRLGIQVSKDIGPWGIGTRLSWQSALGIKGSSRLSSWNGGLVIYWRF